MAVISSTRNGMIGKCGKPFCGDCCATFPKGSGKAYKRIGKHVEKRKEGRRVSAEIEAELADMVDFEEMERDWAGYGWNPYGCGPVDRCMIRHCLLCNVDAEFRSGDMDEFA